MYMYAKVCVYVCVCSFNHISYSHKNINLTSVWWLTLGFVLLMISALKSVACEASMSDSI